MKTLKLLPSLLLFALFLTFTYADNNSINGTCPGENIEEISGTNISVVHTENGAIAGIGNDRYRMTFPASGTLTIDATNRRATRNARYYFYVSRNNCGDSYGDWNIISEQRGRNHTSTININAGDTIWVRLQSIPSEPNFGRHSYRLKLSFQKAPILAPVANAGPNQSGNTSDLIILDGSGSTSQGNIVSYIWTENGNGLASGVNPTIFSSSIGTHIITLTVTDENGLSATDTMILTISADPLDAINDNFSTTKDNNITRNFISNDKGFNFRYTGPNTITTSNGTATISSTGLFTYTPNVNYLGTDTFNYTITDDSGATDTATVTITISNTIIQSYRPFTLRYQQSLAGNIITIGNTVLVAPEQNTAVDCNTYTNGAFIDNASETNAQYALCSYFSDTTQSFPTTKAKLTLPTAESKVVWAGLYWQALVASGDSKSPANSTNMQIKIKHQSDSNYQTISYDQLNWNHSVFDGDFNPIHDSYSAFKDITYLFKSKPNWNTTGDIYVGDIPIHETITILDASGLGTYGAWSLVVVYDDKSQSIKNFSIYDGWVEVSRNSPSTNINISGFKTPKSVDIENNKTIKSTLSVFTAEGDKRITGDSLDVKPSLQNTFTKLTYASDNQTFDSSIQVPIPFKREPSPTNNQGIDIQAFNLGTSGENIIKPNESSIDIRLTTTQTDAGQDKYWASMVSFSSDLLVPSLCYDYVVQKNGYTHSSNKDRNITTYGNGELKVTIGIRSMEGDFDLDNSHIKLDLDLTGSATLTNVAYSPNAVNTFIPAKYYNGDTSVPDIAIGANASENGGTITRLQRYFAQFNYNQTSSVLDGHFDFDVNTTIDFGSGPVDYKYSTNNSELGTLPISLCSDYVAYHPDLGQFNVERTNSDSSQQDAVRFPLYTQIVGRDFDFSVVAYDANASPAYSQPLIVNTSVDVELIDVKPFNDNTFKCSSPLSSIVQDLPDGNRSIFVRLNNTSRTDVTSTTDLLTNKALENAAFRMWVLVDKNNSIVENICPQPETGSSGEHYDACYINNIKDKIYDPLNRCDESNCSTYVSPNDPKRVGCYACYRDYSAMAICSRDNFSIRPETYRLAIIDDNEDNGTEEKRLLVNSSITRTSLAAEYSYRFEGNATKFNSDEIALQYQKKNNATLEFNDALDCIDQTETNTTYSFFNGQIIKGDRYTTEPRFSYHNVGDYLLHMKDKEWTRVDQRGGVLDDSGADLKPFPSDDCNKDNGDTSINGNTLSGCDIMSNFDANHTDIALTFEPYQFDISNVAFTLLPNNDVNFLLMNDFSTDYYNTEGNGISMSAHMEGIIEAQGKNSGKLSNFTAACHANDKNITLIIGRDTTPIAEQNLTSSRQNKDGSTSVFSNVFLQQKLTMNVADSQTVLGTANNVVLSGLEFNDADEGTSSIVLDVTFKKPPMNTHTVVNPIDINFTWLLARDINSSSFADMQSHIPDGNQTYNKQVLYYFAKLTPLKKIYGPTPESWKNTPIFVDIYCDYNTTTICRDQFNLSMPSYGDEDGPWFAATMYQKNGVSPVAPLTALGNFDLDISTKNGENASPSVLASSPKRREDVPFEDSDAKQNDINVSLGGTARPSTVEVVVRPAPFLRYSSETDAEGYMRYLVRFIGASVWSGVGNVGKAIETSSSQLNSGRLTW